MSKEYTIEPKFRLIVDHLDAVRTLYEYVEGVGLRKDMQGLSNHLQQELSHSILQPAGWEALHPVDGYLYSSPVTKWRFGKADNIAIEIYLAWPVTDDSESWVGLHVPAKWKKRKLFLDWLKEKVPPSFEHVSKYPKDEYSDETPVFKYVPYRSYIGAKGLFNTTRFLDAFRDATETLVDMEKSIDTALKDLT